jgi:hypothetical protein
VKTKRAQRIQAPSVTLPFRDPETGAVSTAEVWREDIMEWQADPRHPSQFYLVLDFGIEETISTRGFRNVDGRVEGEFVYVETGRVQLDMQPIDIASPDEWDMETGQGLGPPVARFADVPSDEIGDPPGSTPGAGRPMVGWRVHPVSARRKADG